MTDIPYTHGHHESVLRSHRWRTVENSATFLLPHLQPGRSLLDVGCGPGTITNDFARRLSPGAVVGIDASGEVIDEARAIAAEQEGDRATFERADAFHLPFADDSFDIVHAHQVLQHVGDPVALLLEMKRVCQPDGVVAARDSDYPSIRFYPEVPEVLRSIAAYGQLTCINGANWDAGRILLSWAHAAGFSAVAPSASVWCFATPADRQWWGTLWADRFTLSSMADQLVDRGVADRGDLEAFAGGWRQWAASPDGWFALVHGEVLCTP